MAERAPRSNDTYFIIVCFRDRTIFGSAVQHMANNPICPLLIIKDKLGLRSKKEHGRLRFAVCTDGSEKSLLTLQFLMRFLVVGRGDEIVAICVEHRNVDVAATMRSFSQTIAEA